MNETESPTPQLSKVVPAVTAGATSVSSVEKLSRALLYLALTGAVVTGTGLAIRVYGGEPTPVVPKYWVGKVLTKAHQPFEGRAEDVLVDVETSGFRVGENVTKGRGGRWQVDAYWFLKFKSKSTGNELVNAEFGLEDKSGFKLLDFEPKRDVVFKSGSTISGEGTIFLDQLKSMEGAEDPTVWSYR